MDVPELSYSNFTSARFPQTEVDMQDPIWVRHQWQVGPDWRDWGASACGKGHNSAGFWDVSDFRNTFGDILESLKLSGGCHAPLVKKGTDLYVIFYIPYYFLCFRASFRRNTPEYVWLSRKITTIQQFLSHGAALDHIAGTKWPAPPWHPGGCELSSWIWINFEGLPPTKIGRNIHK